ncbi:MAG: L,D-transpeptidase [Bilophila sp.]
MARPGSGIWLHSRGGPVTPYESHGCVVVDLDDMSILSHRLKRGTPVIIAERLRTGNDGAASEAAGRVEADARLVRGMARRGKYGRLLRRLRVGQGLGYPSAKGTGTVS